MESSGKSFTPSFRSVWGASLTVSLAPRHTASIASHSISDQGYGFDSSSTWRYQQDRSVELGREWEDFGRTGRSVSAFRSFYSDGGFAGTDSITGACPCRHGDLFYLEPSRSVTKSFEETILVSPPLSPVSADSSLAFSGWSHAEIYSRIRRMLMSSKTRG